MQQKLLYVTQQSYRSGLSFVGVGLSLMGLGLTPISIDTQQRKLNDYKPNMSSETGILKMSPVNSHVVCLASIPDVPSNTCNTAITNSIYSIQVHHVKLTIFFS